MNLTKLKCLLGLHTFDWHGIYHGFHGKMWVVQCPYCMRMKITSKDNIIKKLKDGVAIKMEEKYESI
jgi:hypothetical protein